MLAEDIKTLDSLKDAVDILIRFAEDTMQSEGHGVEASTALVFTHQQATNISENIEQLRNEFLARNAPKFGLQPDSQV